MIRNRALWLVLPIASIVAWGCDKSSSDNPSTVASGSASAVASTAAAVSAAPSASAHGPRGMFGRHGGIAAGLFRAAHDLDLPDAQKASLNGIETSLKADDEEVRTAMKLFREDLLAGVKAGKLDTVKLTADNGLVDKAIADHKTKEAEALDALHALLDEAQRTSLALSARTRQGERETRMTGMLTSEGEGGAPDWTKKRVDSLTADLGLDADQQKQIVAILTKGSDPPNAAGMKSRWDDVKKRTDALLTAFAGEAFNAKTTDLTILPGKTPHEPMDHMVAFFSKLLPILRPDQRDKLATDLDKPFGLGGGPGMRRGMRMRTPADDIVFPFEEPVDNVPGAPPGSRP
jgi:Spy/CpxP family protein refolding chaperone